MNKNILILLLIILSGCAQKRENKEIDPSFFTKPSTILITETTGLKSPSYHVHMDYDAGGNLIAGLIMGLARGIAESANQEAAQAVMAMDVSHTVSQHYYEPFKKSFENRHMTITIPNTPLLPEALVEAEKDDHKFAPFDFKFLKDHHNVEYALILNPVIVGITRRPGLFGQSIKNVNLAFYLINLSDNSVEGYYNASVSEAVVGEWDTPPDYDPLTKSLEETLAKAFDQAYEFFFKTPLPA